MLVASALNDFPGLLGAFECGRSFAVDRLSTAGMLFGAGAGHFAASDESRLHQFGFLTRRLLGFGVGSKTASSHAAVGHLEDDEGGVDAWVALRERGRVGEGGEGQG